MTTPSGAPRWCTECRTRRQCPRRAPRVMRSLRSAVVLGASGAYRNGTKKRTAKRRHAKHERERGGRGGRGGGGLRERQRERSEGGGVGQAHDGARAPRATPTPKQMSPQTPRDPARRTLY